MLEFNRYFCRANDTRKNGNDIGKIHVVFYARYGSLNRFSKFITNIESAFYAKVKKTPAYRVNGGSHCLRDFQLSGRLFPLAVLEISR